MMKLQQYWYQSRIHPLLFPLIPFSYIFASIIRLRKKLYQTGVKKSFKPDVPTVIIGNITVGGTGKTPFVIWLVNYLKAQHKNPGIAVRGVGGKKNHQPVSVVTRSNPRDVGDEAVLLAQTTFCPVVACIDRVAAVNALKEMGCDIVICDDGLQHYALQRDMEIAIVDGQRYFGNHLLLPAGPLREPVNRLKQVDCIVINQPLIPLPDSHHRLLQLPTFSIRHHMDAFVSIYNNAERKDLHSFTKQKVHAIAGIGNPQRFFAMLASLGIEIIPHVFPDHHQYQNADLAFNDSLPIIMTEKDAVKCRLLTAHGNLNKTGRWFLRLNTEVGEGLKQIIQRKLNVKKI